MSQEDIDYIPYIADRTMVSLTDEQDGTKTVRLNFKGEEMDEDLEVMMDLKLAWNVVDCLLQALRSDHVKETA